MADAINRPTDRPVEDFLASVELAGAATKGMGWTFCSGR